MKVLRIISESPLLITTGTATARIAMKKPGDGLGFQTPEPFEFYKGVAMPQVCYLIRA
ncbi:MAG TPA: hypothetical protein VF543_01205 [Pyrinomonadaceae bacterium]